MLMYRQVRQARLHHHQSGGSNLPDTSGLLMFANYQKLVLFEAGVMSQGRRYRKGVRV